MRNRYLLFLSMIRALRAAMLSALRATVVLLLLAVLLPAISIASAQTDASAGTQTNVNAEASAGADEEAQAKELGTAVGSFWTLAWKNSWPFIKSMALKFWGVISKSLGFILTAFKEIGGSVQVNANASIDASLTNGALNVNGALELQ